MIEFISPSLGFLLLLPLLIKVIFPELKIILKKDDQAIVVPFFNDFKRLPVIKQTLSVNTTLKTESNILISFLRNIAWLLLVIAVMRPVYIGEKIPVEREGRNLMLAIDVSGSMRENDFVVNLHTARRIDVAKKLSQEFILKRKGDRVGIVIFGTTAHLFVPLTYDVKTAAEMINELDIGLIHGNTAIGDAIGIALQNLKQTKTTSNVLILLTDGESNAGILTNEAATKIAKARGLKIYTVGIGSESIRIPTPFGNMANIKNPYAIDEESLRYIADETGGEYFRASDTSKFKEIYNHIDKIEKIENEDVFIEPKKELFYYPLTVAFALFLLVVLHKAGQVL